MAYQIKEYQGKKYFPKEDEKTGQMKFIPLKKYMQYCKYIKPLEVEKQKYYEIKNRMKNCNEIYGEVDYLDEMNLKAKRAKIKKMLKELVEQKISPDLEDLREFGN